MIDSIKRRFLFLLSKLFVRLIIIKRNGSKPKIPTSAMTLKMLESTAVPKNPGPCPNIKV